MPQHVVGTILAQSALDQSNGTSMKVYRIEDHIGRGMYIRGRAGDSMQGERHPSPYREGMHIQLEVFQKKVVHNNAIFGFPSVALMRRWVFHHAWRKWLAEDGFRVVVFEVPDEKVLMMKRQCVFDRTASQIIETHSPRDMGRIAA